MDIVFRYRTFTFVSKLDLDFDFSCFELNSFHMTMNNKKTPFKNVL